MTSRPSPAVVDRPASDDEAYTQRIHAVLNAALDRLHSNKERAIILAGINLPHETETWDRLYGVAVETLNAEAERIGLLPRWRRVPAPFDEERPTARPFFINVEPADLQNLLITIATLAELLAFASDAKPIHSLMLDWLLNLMFARFSDDEIERDATARGGLWDGKFRFRKSVVEAKHQLAAARDKEDDQKRHHDIGLIQRRDGTFADVPGLAAVLNEALSLKGERQHDPRGYLLRSTTQSALASAIQDASRTETRAWSEYLASALPTKPRKRKRKS